MNPEIKAKWLAALRSGEYKQGRGELRNGDSFCCLGVLCDLHSKDSGIAWDGAYYLTGIGLPPPEVWEWANLPEQDPKLDGFHITGLNDEHGFSFNQLADIIEQQL